MGYHLGIISSSLTAM